MKTKYNIQQTLRTLIAEQAPSTAKVTDNAPKNAVDSPFTPAEEKFLGKFDAYGTRHLGILYSPSDAGVREFITRSGADLNITPEILLSLIRHNIIKVVPYTGFGRNTDYTLELQLSLDDVAGLGAADKEKAQAGATGGGAAPAPGAEETPPVAPAPEVAWVVKYGDVLKETITVAKQLISEKKDTKKPDAEVYTSKSRVLRRLPKQYIRHLERIIDAMLRNTKTTFERERLIADILDNLQVNFDLSAKHIRQSYEFHRSQKRLQKELEKNK
jgi:hypothetical protein